MNQPSNYRLILTAGEIPLHSIVTKRTGSKPYKLLDGIKLYGEQGLSQSFTVASDCRVLMDASSGCGNIIASTTELVWHASYHDMCDFFNPEEDK